MRVYSKFLPLSFKQACLRFFLKVQKGVYRTHPYIRTVNLHLIDPCNLNCKGCSTFAPLVKEGFVSVSVLGKDLQELSRKISVSCMDMLGGEPLLHPELEKIIPLVRKIFPKAKLLITTNGILLPTMSSSFWDVMRKNSVRIILSVYPPTREKWKEFVKIIRREKIGLENIYDRNIKTKWEKMTYSFSENGEYGRIYKKCKYKNCITLFHSKLYHCNACYFEFYNKYFHENHELLPGYDIYQYSGRELERFMNQPDLYCRHCGWVLNTETIPWDYSKREKSEWCADIEEGKQ